MKLPVVSTAHAVAWLLWAIFAFNAVVYLMAPFAEERTSTESYDWINILIFALMIAAFIEAAITFIIRYLFITKPYRKGTYSPNKKFARYFIVGFINWFISNSITLYGIILYYLSGFYWPYFLFGICGFGLLVYHSPRLGPFKENEKHTERNDTIDSSWSKVE